jgi:hypothetical protein
MSSNQNMNNNKRKRNMALVAGVLAIAMVAATLVGGQAMTAASAQVQPPTPTTGSEQDNRPTVSTSGSANIKVSPDKVRVDIGVETKGDTAAKAAADNARTMKRMLDALAKLGVGANQTATSNYSVFPIYGSSGGNDTKMCIQVYPQPPECRPGEIVGYRAVNTVTVTLDASANVGKVIDAAVGAGANNVSGAYYFLSEQRQQEIRDSLIEKAIANARGRADKAASAVGMQVVGVKSVNLNDVFFPVFYKNLSAQESSGDGTEILPGQQDVSMTVQITYVMG